MLKPTPSVINRRSSPLVSGHVDELGYGTARKSLGDEAPASKILSSAVRGEP
jgi:hypothetical protein